MVGFGIYWKINFMKTKTKDNKVIVFVGLLVAAFVLFNFVGADEDALNYFQDRDGDGLSDTEEKALGTDWQNEDTDGDGYTDGVEVSSGFNPLIPAPGDRFAESEGVRGVEVKGIKKERKNLTQEFIEKLKNRKSVALDTFQEVSGETGLVTDLTEIQKLKNTSLTKEDIDNLTQETLAGSDIDEEIGIIEEGKFKILPKVVAKSTKKKNKAIKKELEEYLAVTGFVMVNSLPFKVDENSDFNEKLDKFMRSIGDDIVTGSRMETKNSKNNLGKAFGELMEVEVPYVVKDVHIRSLSLIKYLLAQDESVVFSKDDPIAMGLMIGRLQSVMNKMQDAQDELDGILLKYDVGIATQSQNDAEQTQNDAENEEE